MSDCGWRSTLIGLALVAHVSGALAKAPPRVIATNQSWEVLPDPDQVGPVESLRQAADLLGDWTISLGGIRLDGNSLARVVRRAEHEPYLRALREQLRLPIDNRDFLLFLDDLLVAGDAGLRGRSVWVPSGRARQTGILVHPDDVFRKDRPRDYPHHRAELCIDKPHRPQGLVRARDGEVLGPNWILRYRNPGGEKAKLDALRSAHPNTGFAERIRSLVNQLRGQGAAAYITSTVRNKNRGYLMWGAFLLSRAKSEVQVTQRVERLQTRNKQWQRHVPIQWRHPDGWKATVDAARQMAEAYDVVYATEGGARASNHYDGVAVDLVGRALPRVLVLDGPDGARRVFELSDPNQSRDLSLTPELIDWVETHFQLQKLRFDYPHWNDAVQEVAAVTPASSTHR